MEAAAAFSIACGVLQVIDFGVRAAKALHEIYKSENALTSEISHLHYLTQGLSTSTSEVVGRYRNVDPAQLSPEKTQLLHIAQDCHDTAKNLFECLDKLSLTGPKQKRQVFKQWWKLRREKEKIDKDQLQLERLRKLLDTTMLVNLCRDLDASSEQQSKLLDTVNLNQIRTLAVFKEMSNEFQAAFNVVLNLLEQHVTSQAESTRQLLRDYHFESRDREVFEQLLDSLGFPTITSRKEELEEPYPETFEWILRPDAQRDSPGGDFLEWLETGQTIYWVRGKPGSGKSTASHNPFSACSLNLLECRLTE